MKRLSLTLLIAARAFAQVSAIQNPVPGATSSINTLNPSIQVQGPYAGSVPDAKPVEGILRLSLRDAIARGLRTNLSGAQFQAAMRQAQGQAAVSRSSLLPNISGNLREVVTKTNLRAFGVRFPGAPTVVGPFNYFDLRATVTQSLFDLNALSNYRAAKENIAINEHRLEDARDIVVLGVTGAYLQVITAAARIQSAKSQVETAKTLFTQASQQNKEGVLALVDANRSQVVLQTQQQRLITLENDLAKQKLNLSRIIGLPLGQQFELSDAMPTGTDQTLTLDQALEAAYKQRADLMAAEAGVRTAELQVAANRAERLPSLSVNADYGAIGTNPSQSAGTYTATAGLRIPIWAGGRVSGEIQQSAAQLDQRKAELADAKGRIDSDIRSAFLDLESAANQIRVAQSNIEVARQNLALTRQRFEAGITDTAEVSQAQDTVAAAEQDLITTQFAQNLARAVLARSMGKTEQSLSRFINLP